MKIKFVFSDSYEEILLDSSWLKKFLKKNGLKPYSKEEILKYMKSIEKIWSSQEEKILKEISRITGLKWKEKELKCYISGSGRPISDPLTIRVYKNKNDFVDTLIHELLHQIQIQNEKKLDKFYKYLWKKFPKESYNTIGHILVHAVHWKILEGFFGKTRLQRNVNFDEDFPDYKRSWEIVKKETPEKIIKKFRELAK